ncbi:alkaline phosphatase family protein [Paenibacillus sp. HWE-109]|uniref:alkaline phosphatase family protein n=1 Tax=Paenibacillus sp. HWE-109 TaxID=1306526 RepID=UPI001EE0E1F2|nr:alkaline phosphatase family protein [Paenibacillus sp. HWE-109]UKS25266.1 alkaline phosphatase family protein [Paenibacillus sp. HWE-109]
MTSTSAIKRVIILGIDGAGAFVKQAPTPHIDALLMEGSQTDRAQTVFPSNSGECWGSLLHGVLPEKHESHLHIKMDNERPISSPTSSLFQILSEAKPDSKMASFVCWRPIQSGVIENNESVHKFAAPDEALVPAIAAYIRSTPDLELLFVQLDDVDAAGHRHGYGSEGHLLAISQADGQIGEICQTLLDAGMLAESLIIITTDHGGGGVDEFDHGSDQPGDMTIFWGCRGPGVAANADLAGLTIMDTAAVALHALGLPIPGDWDGKLPEGLFRGEG